MKGPIFLERRSYRRRRLIDALRLLPILGAMLFMLPLFWPVSAPESPDAAATDPVRTSRAMLYIFGVWAALILAAGGLARGLRTNPGTAQERPGARPRAAAGPTAR